MCGLGTWNSTPRMSAGLPLDAAGAHAFGKLANKVRDRRHRRGRRLVAGAEALAYRIDQRRADHDAVGIFGDGAGLVRRAHTEADTDRKFCMPLDASNR